MELHDRIDVHTHYLPPAYSEMLDRRGLRFLDGGMPRPDWSVEKHLKNMEELSVIKAYLSVSSPHLHMGNPEEAAETARGCNEFGAGLMKAYPGKFGIMASLPLPEIEASTDEIRYCADVLKIRGFSLMTNSCGVYLGNPVLDPVMEELNRIHAVVSLHPTEPSAVPSGVCERLPLPLMEFFFDTTRTVINMILNRTFQKYPDIRFIVPHAGAVIPILADRLKGLPAVLPEFQDVNVEDSLRSLYYDLAGMVFPTQYTDLVLMKIPQDHLLYGSDGTFTPQPLCRKLAEAMDRALKDDLARIYLDNPGNLFAW
ncbi:MAG: amidohydrolase family protein [Parasporobacterium sp.]|nr:amidohydrolase family protein [Parasporobacterium sp.]